MCCAFALDSPVCARVQVESKTLFVARGEEIPSHARQLAHHFQTQVVPDEHCLEFDLGPHSEGRGTDVLACGCRARP